MRILLVEDEPSSCARAGQGAARAMPYAVDVAATASAALASRRGLRLRRWCILDVMLPGRDGFAVCRDAARRRGAAVPVLMLTARDAVDDADPRARRGADDYLIKPFDFGELLARLRALMRRGRQPLLPERCASATAGRSIRATPPCARAAARCR